MQGAEVGRVLFLNRRVEEVLSGKVTSRTVDGFRRGRRESQRSGGRTSQAEETRKQ